jgi:hypothetical protein
MQGFEASWSKRQNTLWGVQYYTEVLGVYDSGLKVVVGSILHQMLPALSSAIAIQP